MRHLLLPIAAAIICSLVPLGVKAQIPGLTTPSAASPSAFQTATISVDGFPALQIATLAAPPAGAPTLASRVYAIDGAIAEVLTTNPDNDETIYDPQSFHVEIVTEDGAFTLEAADGRHKTPLELVTITTDDAQNANTSQRQLAQQWQATLQTSLTLALERRQPVTLEHARTTILWLCVAVLLLSAAGAATFRALKNRTVAVGIAWALVIVWGAAITYGLHLFPQTIEYSRVAVRSASSVAIICVLAVLFDWLLGIALSQIVRALATFGVAPGAHARAMLRVPTMSRALEGFKRFLVIFIALLAILSAVQIPIASVVTIGGIAAVAVGFAAQSLVRDFLNGLLVLFEDQYVVGDYIAIGAFNGVVEQFTLRVVQLRDAQGNLITIPHSSVTQVVNASRNWSRIDYQLSLDAGADIRKAVETLEKTLDELKADEQWGKAVIQPYEWVGLHTMSKERSVLRAIVRTAPLRQFELRRELNARVFEAFKAAEIPLGADQATTLLTAMTQSPIPG